MVGTCLILASIAFTATVLAVPRVIRFARRLGAIDNPDGFRKAHAGATPRMGGFAVAFGLLAALAVWLAVLAGPSGMTLLQSMPTRGLATAAAFLVILGTGFVDDRRGLSPSVKLVLQGIAGVLLFADGCRIERFFVFGIHLDFAWLALPVTVFWFLACANIWNLIDGMDGLASGVGLIVSLTLMAASALMGNFEVSYASAALAGALAGFLVFNFHPARIFLGDTGSLLIGTLLGKLAIEGSLKSGMTVAILVPILAMGLPIVDTLLAIIRRWVRHLPWNTADHGHLHHRLIAFGLSTRQASLFLYSFTLILCVSALASVALQSDELAVMFAAVGAAGLTAVFMARREDATRFFEDFRLRLTHRQLEQRSARAVWEAIQRLAHARDLDRVFRITDELARRMACASYALTLEEGDRILRHRDEPLAEPSATETDDSAERSDAASPRKLEPQRVSVRLAAAAGQRRLTLELEQREDAAVPLSLAGKFLLRFNREAMDRIELILGQPAFGAEEFREARFDEVRSRPVAVNDATRPTPATTAPFIAGRREAVAGAVR